MLWTSYNNKKKHQLTNGVDREVICQRGKLANTLDHRWTELLGKIELAPSIRDPHLNLYFCFEKSQEEANGSICHCGHISSASSDGAKN